ncbi:PQQ-binding-like beta-propeller repeat protein [Nonomuraea sp. NPDC059007]|uniref:PQQ-binding-like beta-propeller repeat protein n=1 Tax=Nonomuraea sp. NPDC059007 TaxID=3346692 RepID=UPI0036A5A6F6
MALDAGSGNPRWRQRIEQGAGSDGVAVTGDTVFVAGADDRLHAFDRITGSPRWQFPVGAPILAGPWADGGEVYVSGGGALHKLDAATGEALWSFATDRDGDSAQAMTVAGGTVYLGRAEFEGVHVDAVDTTTGWRRWTQVLDGESAAEGPTLPCCWQATSCMRRAAEHSGNSTRRPARAGKATSMARGSPLPWSRREIGCTSGQSTSTPSTEPRFRHHSG